MRTLILATFVPLALAIPAPSFAKEAAEQGDMNRQVCKKIEVLGSRLKAKKVCMTAGEWEAQRAQDRMDVERNQAIRTKGNE